MGRGVPTLTANMGTGGHNVPFIREFNEGETRAVLTPDREDKRQRGRRFKEHEEASFTLSAQDRHGVATKRDGKVSIRKLTPLECERLQGLPDGFTQYYNDGSRVPDSERYERCGRTISIPVVEAIGRGLHEFA